MKRININLKYLILLWILLIFAIIPTYAHHGNFLIDSGREVYYPTQVLAGKILYKDIFNIYGPFAYMLNALLFKFFSINLNVLYIAGCISSFFIVSLTYLIASKFLTKFLSFSIAVLTIVLGVLNLNLFNFIFPYSYAMLYGLVAFMFSVWFLLQYQTTSEKTTFLYLSSFFAGLCITSKYDFLPYLIVILYAALKIKPLKVKEYLLTLFYLLLIPAICFGILFLQGLRVNNLISTFSIINKIAQSQTLNYFYLSQGVYFNIKSIPSIFSNSFKILLPLAMLVYSSKLQNKKLSLLIILTATILTYFWLNPASFIFLPVFILTLLISNFKKLSNSPQLMILILSALSVSLKTFWGLLILSYGVFFVSFILITLLAMFVYLTKDKNFNYKLLGIYILIISAVFCYKNISLLSGKSYLLITDKGKIYLHKNFKEASEEVIKYIQKNTKPTDKIVVLPEGTFINFLTNRKSDDYYNSMIPLYFEAFGEKAFIDRFTKEKPDYIIFNNYDMSKDYYFKNICNDYAFSFCSFTAENYKQIKTIDKGLRYLIFRRK